MAKREAKMTNRERVEALLRREKPDRIPHWPIALGFSTIYTGTTIADYYNKPEVSIAAQRKTAKDFDFVFMPWMGSATILAWEFGGEIKWPSGEYSQAPTIVKHPVETVDDVFKLKLPDVKTAGYIPMQMEFSKLSAKDNLDFEPFNVTLNPGSGPFTAAAQICGADKFVKWMIKNPDAVHRLLRLAVDFYISLAEYWKDTFGVDRVLPLLGEPTASNAVISPEKFEEFALPYFKEYAQRLREIGYKSAWIHICGDQTKNLPHWAKTKFGDPGIYSIAHEMDIEEAGEYLPNDIIFGNIEPAIIQTGTANDVYEETRKLIEKGKKLKCGYIFSQGCEMPPMSPLENVKAMNQALDDYGWYD